MSASFFSPEPLMNPWRTALSILVVFAVTSRANVEDPINVWRVSTDSSGMEGVEISSFPAISANGRFVAFGSGNRFVPADTDDRADIYLRDRRTGVTTQVSVDSSGVGADRYCLGVVMSTTGRFIAFSSPATNLVPGDTNDYSDVFVHDRETGQTTRVSVDSSGMEGNGPSQYPGISGDGRFVVFFGSATNLVQGDLNQKSDVFLHDRATATTTRVSVDNFGNEGDDHCCEFSRPVISIDGDHIAFSSKSTNLVPIDTNGWDDIFVHERKTGAITRVSVTSSGAQADDRSEDVAISANGQTIAFQSRATNLVANDTNDEEDLFVHDRVSGATTRVSVDSNGAEGDFDSDRPALSWDGRIVAFQSRSRNLVLGDTNHHADVFTHDRNTGLTVRVSVGLNGQEGNDQSDVPAISADGRLVAYHSLADNLISGDTNDNTDIFVRGPYLILEAEAPSTAPGSPITFSTWTGQASGRALLAGIEVNGSARFFALALGTFDARGEWQVGGIIPPGLTGNVMTFQAYGFDPTGSASSSTAVAIEFQ